MTLQLLTWHALISLGNWSSGISANSFELIIFFECKLSVKYQWCNLKKEAVMHTLECFTDIYWATIPRCLSSAWDLSQSFLSEHTYLRGTLLAKPICPSLKPAKKKTMYTNICSQNSWDVLKTLKVLTGYSKFLERLGWSDYPPLPTSLHCTSPPPPLFSICTRQSCHSEKTNFCFHAVIAKLRTLPKSQKSRVRLVQTWALELQPSIKMVEPNGVLAVPALHQHSVSQCSSTPAAKLEFEVTARI